MSKRVAVLYAAGLVGLLALFAYFAFSVGTDRGDWMRIAARMREWGGQTWSPLLLLLSYYAGSLMSMPGLLMLTVLVACVGSPLGLVLAMLGTIASASTVHALSRALGRTLVAEFYPRQLERVERLLAGPPLFRVLQMRLMPVFPFHVVNAVCGLVGIPLRLFALGTVIGCAPKMLVEVTFVRALMTGLTAPRTVMATNVAVSLALFVIVTLVGVHVDRRLRTPTDLP